jgi:flavorubredoxin
MPAKTVEIIPGIIWVGVEGWQCRLFDSLIPLPWGKLAAYFGSYGWAGDTASQVKGLLEPAGVEIVEALEIKGPPGERELESAVKLGRDVARRAKESLGSGRRKA